MDEKMPRKLRVPNENEEWAMEIPLPEGEGGEVREEIQETNEKRYLLWRRIGRGALFVAIFLAPLLFLPFTQFPVETAKTVVISTLLVIALVSFFVCVMERRVLEYPRSLLALAVGIFTFIVGLSTIFSTSYFLSLYGKLVQPDSFLATAVYALAFFLSFYFFTKEDLPKIGRTVIIALSLATLLGILQMYHIYLWPWGFTKANAFSTFGTTFGWGVFMMGLIIAAVYSRTEEGENETKGKGLTTAAIIAAIGLIVINYQFLWVALAIAMLVIAAIRFMAHENFRTPLILVAVALFFAFAGSRVPTGAAQITEVRPNLQSTTSIAGGALHGARLFLGAGPSTFSEQFARFRGQGLNMTNFWSAPFSQGYDFFLTLLATTGILGVLAFFLILFAFVRIALKSLHHSEIPNFLPLPLFLLAAMLFFYPGFFALMFLLFVGFAALLLSNDGIRHEISFERLKRPALLIVFIVAIAAGVASLAAGYRIIEKYAAMAQYADAAAALGAGNLPFAGAKIQSAVSLDNTSDDAWRTGSQVAFAQGRQAFQQASSSLDAAAQAAIGTAVTAAQNAVKLDQNNVYNWIALGNVYEGLIPIANGADTLAVTAYQSAQKIDPWNPDLPVALARVAAAMATKLSQAGQKDAAQAKLNEAEVQLTQAITLKPNYATPRFMLAQLYIQEGSVGKAIQRVQEIEAADPQNAGLAFQLGLLYYQNNQTTQAQQEFARAVSLDSNYSNARYFLGLIDDQRGDTADAIAQFQAVAKLNPDNAEVKQILDNLNAGKPALEGISPPGPAPTKRTDVPLK